MRIAETARLAGFFAALAVKERVAPRLHVRPLVAECFLTDNCNLKCISCNCWREFTRGELSTLEWQSVLQQLADLGIHKVNFTGGEPLIRQDAVGLMRFANECGIRHMHLNTNAIRLTGTLREQVIEAGVRSFNISVDGPNGLVHDRIRGQLGAFETTISHLKELLAERINYPLKVRMNFTVMRDNVHHLAAMARLAQSLDVRLYLNLATDSTFLFRAAEVSEQTKVDKAAIDRALSDYEDVVRANSSNLPSHAEMRYLVDHFDERVQRKLPCAESQLKLMIHSTGGVGGCWGHDPTANVRTTPLAEIIDAAAYRDEHARLFRKDCVGCGSNYSLNLRWRPSTHISNVAFKAGMHRDPR